jgi:hypothetical protein
MSMPFKELDIENMLPEQRAKVLRDREIRNERARKNRAERRAKAIAAGTYKQPRRADLKWTGADDVEEIPQLPHQKSRDKRMLYLAYLEKGVKRTVAAERAGVSYTTVKYWRRVDPEFLRAEAEVEETFLDNVEDVVRQLAQANDLKAALTILERRRPEVWAPRKEVHVEHTLQFAGSLEQRMERITALMEAAQRPALEPLVWDDADVIDDPALPRQLNAGLESAERLGHEAGSDQG